MLKDINVTEFLITIRSVNEAKTHPRINPFFIPLSDLFALVLFIPSNQVLDNAFV